MLGTGWHSGPKAFRIPTSGEEHRFFTGQVGKLAPQALGQSDGGIEGRDGDSGCGISSPGVGRLLRLDVGDLGVGQESLTHGLDAGKDEATEMASIREQQVVGDGGAGIEDEDRLAQELVRSEQG